VQLFRSMLAAPTPGYTQLLESAMAVTESSAWRGNGGAAGEKVLNRLSAYITSTEQRVTLSTVSKATLAGTSGTLPVSVDNGLGQPVRVRVVATSGRGGLTVRSGDAAVTVPARQIRIVKLSLNSLQIGTTQLQLQLVTGDGSPLPWTTEKVSVVSTRYGRAVLVLVIVALGIVVLTAATRGLRRWFADGRAAGQHGGAPEGEPEDGEGSHLAGRNQTTGGDR